MKTLMIFAFLFTALSISANDDCEKKLPEAELEKAYKAKIKEEIARYGRFSRHTFESLEKPSDGVRVARIIRLERECKTFEFGVSISGDCVPSVELKSLETCQR